MKATGFACDVCKVFATAEKSDRPPNGWMKVSVYVADEFVRNGTVNTAFDICSNKCLAVLGKERAKAERETGAESNGLVSHPERSMVISTGKREFSDEARASFRQNGLKMQHAKGNHESTPKPDCESCQEATGMTEDELRSLLDAVESE